MVYSSAYFTLAVEAVRPGVKSLVDYAASDEGNGPFISAWNRADLTQPTQAEIESVDTDALASKVQAVTPRQARLALLAAGLLDQVESAVTAAGGATKIAWDYATIINRDDPLISAISSGLGLTAEQIDALFKSAAAL